MDLLEKKVFYNSLYEYYKELFTTKQQTYFQNYYYDDLSLSEIAQMHNVSRNAVFDQLKKMYILLEQYEEKMGLLNQATQRNALYEEYIQSKNVTVLELIEKLKDLE